MDGTPKVEIVDCTLHYEVEQVEQPTTVEVVDGTLKVEVVDSTLHCGVEGVSERAVDHPRPQVSTIWHHCHSVSRDIFIIIILTLGIIIIDTSIITIIGLIIIKITVIVRNPP